jgi:3',5'-cyclic AMP phosphodiesterase CpdA
VEIDSLVGSREACTFHASIHFHTLLVSVMQTILRLISVLTILSVSVGCSRHVIRPAQLHPAPDISSGQRTVLVIADNQERQLTGAPLASMSPISERVVTSVALRSPLANVGGMLLMQEVIGFGRRHGADLVLHLGDAADISCPDEFLSTMDALESAAPGAWFIAPGNHDGLLAGTFARYQPSLAQVNAPKAPIHTTAPNEPMPVGRSWLHACLSPGNIGDRERADVLTKGDVVELYMRRIGERAGAASRSLGIEELRISGASVRCRIEEMTIERDRYRAIARICPRTDTGNATTWVGPYASYVVQRLEVAGVPFLLLDTSLYDNPSVHNVGLTGSIGADQRRRAEALLSGVERHQVVFAGHHPVQDLTRPDRSWLAENAARYMSGHVHRSASLIDHRIGSYRLTELNIGSTLDHPAQGVLARVSRPATSFRVVGADVDHTGWAGFLEPCEARRSEWQLPDAVYTGYTQGHYPRHLLESLRAAAARAPGTPLTVPAGTQSEDWGRLDALLSDIRTSEGEARTYWSCQAYFASEATATEISLLDRISRRLGRGFKSGAEAVGYWFSFASPE